MNSVIVLMFIAIIVIGGGLLLAISLTRRPSKQLNQDQYRAEWLQITNSLRDDPAVLQMSILQADKLLDKAMRERGVAGTNLGERLKNGKTLFRNLDGVWRAHKLRNQIAHESTIHINMSQTRTALDLFKAALTDLGAL